MTRSDFEDLTGKRFGRLVAMKLAGTYPDGRHKWLCQCDCGNQTIARGDSLKRMTSCGCIRREKNIERFFRHGDSRTKLYKIHTRLIQATTNPNFKSWANYGGKGVSLAEEWKDWPTFRDWALANGYAPGKQIHRIDSEGNYSPENCVWLTVHEHQKHHGSISSKPIEQLDEQGNVVATFANWPDLKAHGFDDGGVRRSIRTGYRCAGFHWRRRSKSSPE